MTHTNAERNLQMNNSYWRLTFFWEYENFWLIVTIVMKNVFEYQQFRVTLILRECFKANISVFELYSFWENAFESRISTTHTERECLEVNISHSDLYSFQENALTWVSALLAYTYAERKWLEVNIKTLTYNYPEKILCWDYLHFRLIIMLSNALKWISVVLNYKYS